MRSIPMPSIGVVMALGAALALAGCASGRSRAPRPQGPAFHPAVEMLAPYDFNHDGQITRGEMEKGLKADFDRADTNHDGRLDEDEVRAVNQRRLARDASTASPLVDWNHDGYVDFDEFANAPRSLFDQLDTDGNGVLSAAELKAARAGSAQPRNPAAGEQRRGRRNGGSGGDSPDGDGD